MHHKNNDTSSSSFILNCAQIYSDCLKAAKVMMMRMWIVVGWDCEEGTIKVFLSLVLLLLFPRNKPLTSSRFVPPPTWLKWCSHYTETHGEIILQAIKHGMTRSITCAPNFQCCFWQGGVLPQRRLHLKWQADWDILLVFVVNAVESDRRTRQNLAITRRMVMSREQVVW